MEEVSMYVQTILSILIAALIAYLTLRIFHDISNETPRKRTVRVCIGTILMSGGIWLMHLLVRASVSGSEGIEEGILIPLAVYGLTIAILMFLISRLRGLLAEWQHLKELAYKDALTGLLNKNGMDHFWSHCKESDKLAVLFLDLNRFKSINDSMGHDVGDTLLQAVGGKLIQFSSKRKRHIFRIGGDEFVVIAKGYSQKEAEQLAVQILEKTTGEYHLGKHKLFVSVSIGISMSSGKVDRTKLLKEADTAMYNAKQLGTGRYSVYKN